MGGLGSAELTNKHLPSKSQPDKGIQDISVPNINLSLKLISEQMENLIRDQ